MYLGGTGIMSKLAGGLSTAQKQLGQREELHTAISRLRFIDTLPMYFHLMPLYIGIAITQLQIESDILQQSTYYRPVVLVVRHQGLYTVLAFSLMLCFSFVFAQAGCSGKEYVVASSGDKVDRKPFFLVSTPRLSYTSCGVKVEIANPPPP